MQGIYLDQAKGNKYKPAVVKQDEIFISPGRTFETPTVIAHHFPILSRTHIH